MSAERRVAAAVLAAGVCLTACGGTDGKPSVAAIAGRLKADTRYAAARQPTLTCIAGVLHRYGSAANLTTYVRTGQESGAAPSIADQGAAAAALKACVARGGPAG